MDLPATSPPFSYLIANAGNSHTLWASDFGLWTAMAFGKAKGAVINHWR